MEALSDSEARRPWSRPKLNGALKERLSARVQRISISHFQCLRPLRHRSRGVVLRFARTCPWLTYFAPLALEVRISSKLHFKLESTICYFGFFPEFRFREFSFTETSIVELASSSEL